MHTDPSTRRRLLLAGLSTWGLAAAPAHAQSLRGLFGGGAPKPVAVGPGANAADLAAQVYGKRHEGKARRVGLSAFQILFQTDSSIEQSSRNSTASLVYRLETPPIETLQALADQARDALAAALQAAGVEVLPQATLLADSDFAARAAEAAQGQVRDPGLLGKRGEVVVNATGTVSNWGVMGKVHEMRLAERLGGDVALLGARFYLSFANLEEMGFWERGTSVMPDGSRVDTGVRGQVGLTVEGQLDGAQRSVLSVSETIGNWLYPVRAPMVLPQPFAKSVDKEAAGGDLATSLIGLALGKSISTTRYKVTPADDYAAQVGAGLAGVMRVSAEVMRRG